MFLGTTGLVEFWKKDEEILFLGMWCLRYERQYEWKELKYCVLPYPWDNKERLEKAYKELESSYENILNNLVEWLNRQHNLKRDSNYWRIVVGPWLYHFLAVVKDRYACLRDAADNYPDVHSMGLTRESFVTPRDFAEFTALSLDDPYNLQLFTQIMEGIGVPFKRQPLPGLQNGKRLFKSSTRLKRAFLSLLGRIAQIARVQLYISLPMRTRMELLRKSAFTVWALPVSIIDRTFSSCRPDMTRRASLANLISGDEFEQIISLLLPQNFPIVYLEAFHPLREMVMTGSVPEVIATDIGLHYHDQLKVYAAEMVSRGTSLVIIQHGGDYGILKKMPLEEHELAICHQYWSWGWQTTENVRPLPAAKLSGVGGHIDCAVQKLEDILWISTMHPRYLYRFHSAPLGPQFKEYFDWQQRFVSWLPKHLRAHLLWRSHHHDYGWAGTDRLKDRFPDLRFDDIRRSFRDGMKRARLLVIDNNATTFLEALAWNKPSVLFWDPKRWEVRDSAASFFDALRDAKVLHDTPESAAAHVATVYEDPWSWWGSETVQAARKRVVQNYANNDPDWANSWCAALNVLTQKVPISS